MKLKFNPANKRYYSDEFIKGFECGASRQYEEDMRAQEPKKDILNKLDAIITDALDKSKDQKESQTLRWVLDKISEVSEIIDKYKMEVEG